MMELLLILISSGCAVFVSVCAISLAMDWLSDAWHDIEGTRRDH